LEVWDSYLEIGQINRTLNECSDVWLARQRSLAEEELRQALTDKSWIVPLGQSADLALIREIEPFAKGNGQVSGALVQDLEQLKQSIEALRVPLPSPHVDVSHSMHKTFMDTFDRMRKTFDDTFYRVDKRTLEEVERARNRVESLEEWLDGLVATQRTKVAQEF
jgi:hypothetical protein